MGCELKLAWNKSGLVVETDYVSRYLLLFDALDCP